MKWIFIFVAFAGIITPGFINKNKLQKKIITQPVKGSYKSFAVLELFTSEGCSSCPPADRLLPELAAISPGIISLSFHVDYWDHLGWKDPFSSEQFSERQRQYGKQFQLEGIYTPQLIINGQYEVVGSSRSTAETEIKKVLNEKPAAQLTIDEVKKVNDKLLVSCHADGDYKEADLFIAVVQNHAEMNVRGGENRGSKLSHTNIVRSFVKKNLQQKMNFEISIPKDIADDNPPAGRQGWQLVLYAQQKKDLKITGAAVYQPKL